MPANLELDQRLRFIGIQLATGDFPLPGSAPDSSLPRIDLEQSLLDACFEVNQDPKMLSLLLSWIQVHGEYVIVEKLMKLAKIQAPFRGQSPWLNALAIFAAHHGINKWKRWIHTEKEPVYLISRELAESAIRIKGAEAAFIKFNFFIPIGALRIRERDVFSQEMLLKTNLQYRYRYLYGASWRADIIYAIELGMKNPSEIAKSLGCSYEPAYRIFHEYELAKRSA